MSLDLDKRQRAMLREMGVRVWQPAAPVAPARVAAPVPPVAAATAVAIDSIADVARQQAVPSAFSPKSLAPVSAPAPAPVAAQPGSSEASWHVGEALALYADTAAGPGPRWLVLAETPAAAVQGGAFDPFAGDAGKLLDNMLRAARLHQAGAALLAPLVRHSGADASAAGGPATLPALLAQARPDVVLVMGRLAAMAVLQTGEAFGKLRGQVHALHGAKAVVTQDAAYLLRQQGDKSKAWEDLCLAMSVAQAPAD